MPLPANLLTENVDVRRRRSTGRDALNNPTYGDATSGDGWYTVYKNFPVKLAFSGKDIKFAPEGERILPSGIMYFNNPADIRQEDRVLTSTGIEYIVIGMNMAYLVGKVVDHYECILQLP